MYIYGKDGARKGFYSTLVYAVWRPETDSGPSLSVGIEALVSKEISQRTPPNEEKKETKETETETQASLIKETPNSTQSPSISISL